MTRIDDQARVVMQERERYLENRCFVGERPAVRPEVAASWNRSMMSRVDPAGVHPDFKKTNTDRLSAAALPVIEHHLQCLSGTSTSILFADSEARLIGRWADDSALRSSLSRSYVEAGFSMSETVVGTNAVGTVFETGTVVEIKGPEHFSEQYLPFTCVGAPIRHPVTRRIVGAIDITCRYQDTSSIARPWIADLARQIEQQLLQNASLRERLLLDSYVLAARRSKQAVICLNEHTLISNSAAAALLTEIDQRAIWEHAERACTESGTDTSTLALPDGRVLRARCRAVRDGGMAVGVVVELRPEQDIDDTGRDGPASRPAARPEAFLPGLAGTGARWANVCAQARNSRRGNGAILVVGEAGTGKLSSLAAMFAEEQPFSVLDCALEPLDGLHSWVGSLRERMQDPRGVVVLRHLEALGEPAPRAVCSLLDAHTAEAPRIVATHTTGQGAVPYGPLLDRLAVHRIALPALRERIEDVPELLRTLTRRHSGGLHERRWLPEAVTVLGRQRWAGNIRELETVVRRVLNLYPAGHIGVANLPDELIRTPGPRRNLSQLEELERQEIIETLTAMNGNKVLTAQRLNLARSTLYRKMRAFGIESATPAE
jgi:transcriptional regulator of acetoin/glycerol metabolism